MPQLNKSEIKDKIADRSIFAISVDTCIFDRYHCRLASPPIRQLDQFRVGDFRVLISEIVYNEVTAHIRQKALETQHVLQNAIRDQAQRWRLGEINESVSSHLKLNAEAAEEATKQVDEFIAAVGAEIVPLNQPDNIAGEVIRRYFSPDLPFEANNKKKHEFPDAFALLSLEHYAKTHGSQILCVSQDQGWQKFAEASDWLVAIADLNDTLSLFNEAGRPIAEKAVAKLREGIGADQIDDAVQSLLDDNDFEVDAWSHIDFDVEDQYATLQQIDLKSISAPTVIAVKDDEVTFTIKFNARILFAATFSFYVRDSIDRDIISLGSQDEEVENDTEMEATITISRDNALPVIVDVQLIRANFDYVEPFKDEDPTFEKY